jgi:integrase
VRAAEGVYQRINRKTGEPVEGKFEFTYRDVTGRQVWQTAKGGTRADAKAERAETFARMHRGQRVERTNLTVGEVANLWLARGTGCRGRWAEGTRERYEQIVRLYIESSPDPNKRPLGLLKLRDVTIDRVADWSRTNERTRAPTTALLALIVLNQVFRFAVRHGWIADNPVAKLEPGEKPRWTPKPVAILEHTDLARLLEHAGSYRALFEFMAYTGLRIGEARGLCWGDVDLEADLLRVHRQLSKKLVQNPLKTEAARREVILARPIATMLRERWLASTNKGPDDLVFRNSLGRGLDYRDVDQRFRAAVRRAGLEGQGRLSPHSLRHGFASLLIAEGLDVVFVSRQLGHANPNTTLSTYAHLFQRAGHAEAAREALEACHELMEGTAGR